MTRKPGFPDRLFSSEEAVFHPLWAKRLTSDDDIYQLYVQNFGKVKSGTKLTDSDYVHPSFGGATPFSAEEKIAVTLGGQDIQNQQPLRSRSEFLEELKRLRS